MKKIIVDIGNFLTAIMTTDSVIPMTFEVDSTTEFTLENILGDRNKTIISNTVKKIVEIANSDLDIKEVNIIVPTKDIVVSSSSKMTIKRLKEIIQNDLQVVDSDEISIGVTEMFTDGKKHYTPISLYDLAFNNIEKSVKSLTNHDIEVKLFSSLDRLIQRGKQTKGRVILFDASYSGVKALVVQDGIPVKFDTLDISGRDLLIEMSEGSDRPLVELNALLSKAFTQGYSELPEVAKALKYLTRKVKTTIKKYIDTNKAESIYAYGGLTNSGIFDKLGIPVIYDKDFYKGEVELEDSMFNYKFIQLVKVPNDKPLNNPMGIYMFVDDTIDMSDEEKINDILTEAQHNLPNDKDYFEQDVVKLLGASGNINNESLRKISDDVNINKAAMYQKNGNAYEGAKIVNPETNEKSILRYHNIVKADDEVIERTKKSRKKLSWEESPFERLVIALLLLVLTIGVVIGAHKFGVVDIPALNEIGIRSQIEEDRYAVVENALQDRYVSMIKNAGVNHKNFGMKTISKKNDKVKILVVVESNVLGLDHPDILVENAFKPLDGYQMMEIEKHEPTEEDSRYKFIITVPIQRAIYKNK